MDGDDGQKGVHEREDFNYFFLLFIFFSDLWKSDRRFLSEQKAKLVYATKAMRRNQYLSVSSNFKRQEISLLVLFRA